MATSVKACFGTGCPSKSELIFLRFSSSASGRKPASAQTAYKMGAAWPWGVGDAQGGHRQSCWDHSHCTWSLGPGRAGQPGYPFQMRKPEKASPLSSLSRLLVFSPKFSQPKVGRHHDRCRGTAVQRHESQTTAGSRHPKPWFWHGPYLDRLLSPAACLGKPEAVELGQRTGGFGDNCGMVCSSDFYQKRKGRVSALLNCSGVSLTRRARFGPQDARQQRDSDRG